MEQEKQISLEDKPFTTFKTKDGFYLCILDTYKCEIEEETKEQFFSSRPYLEIFSKYEVRDFLHNVRGPAIFHSERKGGIYFVNGQILDQNEKSCRETIEKIKSREAVSKTYEELLSDD